MGVGSQSWTAAGAAGGQEAALGAFHPEGGWATLRRGNNPPAGNSAVWIRPGHVDGRHLPARSGAGSLQRLERCSNPWRSTALVDAVETPGLAPKWNTIPQKGLLQHLQGSRLLLTFNNDQAISLALV